MVLQHVLGGKHVLFGVRRGIFLHGAVKPAPCPDQFPDVVEVAFVFVVPPPGEVPVLRRHQLEVNPLGREAPGAVPAGEVEGAPHGPLHQDVARVVLVLAEARHGVVLAAPQLDAVAVVDVVEHPERAAGHHLQSPELLPEEAVQRLETERQPQLQTAPPYGRRADATPRRTARVPFACVWRTVRSSRRTA